MSTPVICVASSNTISITVPGVVPYAAPKHIAIPRIFPSTIDSSHRNNLATSLLLAFANAPNTIPTPSFAKIPIAPTPVAATPVLIPKNDAIFAIPLLTNFLTAPAGFDNFSKISSKNLVKVFENLGAAFLNSFPAFSVIKPRPFLTHFQILPNMPESSAPFIMLDATFAAVSFPATFFNAAALTFMNVLLAPFFAPVFSAVVSDFSDILFSAVLTDFLPISFPVIFVRNFAFAPVVWSTSWSSLNRNPLTSP